MSDIDPAQIIHTRIWQEQAESDNPFAPRTARCRGFDVFGDLVGKIRWVDMLCLLFRDEPPAGRLLDMLEALAVALANPGPRDASIHAAMAGGVCGSTTAACLMAALASGSGRLGGAREVIDVIRIWHECGDDYAAWPRRSANPPAETISVWPDAEHPAGFDPYGSSTATPVKQLLTALAGIGGTPRLTWLAGHVADAETAAGRPLALSGVAGAALADLGFTPEEGEAIFLLLRLPGAAAHAIEQRGQNYRRFPFYPVELEDEPKQQEAP